MKDMTASAMLAVCERAEEIAASSAFGGGIDRKAKKSQAFGDYMRALDAVRGSAAKIDRGKAHAGSFAGDDPDCDVQHDHDEEDDGKDHDLPEETSSAAVSGGDGALVSDAGIDHGGGGDIAHG